MFKLQANNVSNMSAEPTLTGANIQFDTTTDDKESAFACSVRVFTNQGGNPIMRRMDAGLGEWFRDNTPSPSYDIPMTPLRPKKSELQGGKINLVFELFGGSDEWTFNFNAVFSFSDGSNLTSDNIRETGQAVNFSNDHWQQDFQIS